MNLKISQNSLEEYYKRDFFIVDISLTLKLINSHDIVLTATKETYQFIL